MSVVSASGVDDTAAVQAALALGGITAFSAGETYWIDPATGVRVPPGARIVIDAGAEVRALPTSLGTYNLFDVEGVNSVEFSGSGAIIGDLATHLDTAGQYGHLIRISRSFDVAVRGITVREAWGDGIYVGGLGESIRVTIEDVQAIDCRREGIAVFWVDGVLLRDCVASDTGVMALALGVQCSPGSGFDIEPNPGQWVRNLRIETCEATGTQGSGFYIAQNTGPVESVVLDRVVADSCGGGHVDLGLYRFNGIQVGEVSGGLTIISPTITGCVPGSGDDDHGAAIFVRGSSDVTISGGSIHDNDTRAVLVDASSNVEVSGVAILDNTPDDAHVLVASSTAVSVTGNTFRGSAGDYWVDVRDASDECLVSGNVAEGTQPSSGDFVNSSST